MNADLELARLLGYAATELERRGYESHGVVRRAAVRLLELTDAPVEDDDRPDRCRRCRTPIEQKPTGRPRLYCGASCRKGRKRTKPDDVGVSSP